MDGRRGERWPGFCRRGRGALGAGERAEGAAPRPRRPSSARGAPGDGGGTAGPPSASAGGAVGREGRAAELWRRRCRPFPSFPFPSPAPSFLRRGASSPRRSRPPRLALSSPAEEWILEDFRRRDIFSAVSRPALFGMVRPAGARWPWAPPHADAALRPPAPPRPGCGGGRSAQPRPGPEMPSRGAAHGSVRPL